MKILIILLIIALSVGIYSLLPKGTSQDTYTLCREYADRDHEMEIAPARWKWFKDQGIDLNKDFDWYTSCIHHNTIPVAK